MWLRTSAAGRVKSTRASSTVIFGASVTPAVSCGTGCSPAAMASMVSASCLAPDSASSISSSPAVASGMGREDTR